MICKNCGFENKESDITCSNCGSSLLDNQAENIFGDDILKPIEFDNLPDIENIEEKVDIITDEDVSTDDLDSDNVKQLKLDSSSNENTIGETIDIEFNPLVQESSIDSDNNISSNVDNINNIEYLNISPTIKTNMNNEIMDNSEYSDRFTSYKEPFDLKRTLIIVCGLVIASILILISVVIVTSSIKNPKKEVPTKVENNNYKISFNGYDITIPPSLVYEIKGDSLIISDKDEKWMSVIQVSDFNYSKLLVNKDTIKASYEKLGMKVSDMNEKKYGTSTYLIGEMVKLNTELVVGITKASTNQSFVVVSLNKEYKLSYDGIKNTSDILKDAKYTGINKTTNIKSNFFDFSGIKG